MHWPTNPYETKLIEPGHTIQFTLDPLTGVLEFKLLVNVLMHLGLGTSNPGILAIGSG
jgi:hypothetical protein